MAPPLFALGLFGLYAALAFPGRALWQKLRTGDSGLRGLARSAGPIERAAGLLLFAGLAALPAGALAEHSGLFPPLLHTTRLTVLGTVLAVAGVASTVVAQLAMGRSWRIGIRHDEVTVLVMRGPFAWVRNPIYSSMLLAGAGFALLTPNALALAGFSAQLMALELQVRLVEEPHLRALHGETFTEYCHRVGRFAPFVGRGTTPSRGHRHWP